MTSSAGESPVMRTLPVTEEPISNARWEIALSPGTRSSPATERQGLMIKETQFLITNSIKSLIYKMIRL